MMEKLFEYLRRTISVRISRHFDDDAVEELPDFRDFMEEDGPIGKLIHQNNGNEAAFLSLALTLAPQLHPDFLVQTINSFLKPGQELNDICLTPGKNYSGLLPTGETLLFLLAGSDLQKRVDYHYLFTAEHFLIKNNVIQLEEAKPGEPLFSGRLHLAPDYVHLFTTGKVVLPKLSQNFPAELLETSLGWKDLIISKNTEEQLKDLKNWLLYHQQLSEHPTLGKRTRQGFRTLFYGPPGTGKTLTASLLGKYADKPVFRIDLSLMVSKYIGETEKNLAGIFKRAEHKDWILFFDEADALFGKRTDNETANDRFANQEVAYLLQRIENYNGMVILASNLKNHLDKAFMRRFQSVVHFPKPDKSERKLIWNKTLPADLPLDPSTNMEVLCDRYEVTAAQISNIVQACYIDAIAAKATRIEKSILKKNLRNELRKEDLLFEDYL